jgi:hypothetical protein
MRSDRAGCSTCQAGSESYESYYSALLRERRVQYDYRTPGGKLFSTVAPTLEDARQRRDAWLAAND